MAKYIFVLGGVISALGKGIASASIGFLLKRMGYSVGMQKLDPYLNVNPGLMSPFQHGEVFVTDDGGETDLDLGYYERFVGITTTKLSNATSGVVYDNVIKKERNGEYSGKTVQVIPHVTDEIKEMFNRIGKDNDIVIIEIGGTVGDIESLPFLEAIRQYRLEMGIHNSMVVFLTYVPYMRTAGELKTKPTQHSAIKLREIGIQPDIILCRTEMSFEDDIKNKIALFTNVAKTNVKAALNTNCVYEIPKNYYNDGIHEIICNHFGLQIKDIDFDIWDKFLYNINNPLSKATIIICGKYVEHQDAYKSVEEAIKHAAAWNQIDINIVNIYSEKEYSDEDYEDLFKDVDGVLIPGGFGVRGVSGKINITKHAREKNIPLFGICLGMQLAVIEFARNVCGLTEAYSTEFDKNCSTPIIDLLADANLKSEEISNSNYSGIMRLGAYPCLLKENTIAKKIYNEEIISERHRHRYELNNKYINILEQHGMVISGTSPDGNLVEIVEIPSHSFFVGVQYHPEFKSKPDKPHQLFTAFIQAVKERATAKQLTIDN